MLITIIALLVILLAGLAIGLYGMLIEPNKLVITRHEIASPLLSPGFDGLRLVQFSDVHIGPDYPVAHLDSIVEAINGLQPDVVVFTGDLYDACRRNPERDETSSAPLSAQLDRIQASLGKFAIYGNHDFGHTRNKRLTPSVLHQGGFMTLLNETYKLRLPSGEFITIAALDDYVLGRPDPKGVLTKLRPNHFNLLLLHEPDPADDLIRYPVDLQLSGHSHGGQVSLPLVGAPIKTRFGRRYIGGLYRIAARKRQQRPYLLYVNRGIGTTRIKLRIGSIPELSMFTLRSMPSIDLP